MENKKKGRPKSSQNKLVAHRLPEPFASMTSEEIRGLLIAAHGGRLDHAPEVRPEVKPAQASREYPQELQELVDRLVDTYNSTKNKGYLVGLVNTAVKRGK